MSTGKRLAKRSIIGTRVCAPGDDGKYYAGVIQAVKTPAPFADNSNCIQLTPNTRYTVKFDSKEVAGASSRGFREYRECDLIGPGFRTISGVKLLAGQKVYLTFNGREVSGVVQQHQINNDEVTIVAFPPGHEDTPQMLESDSDKKNSTSFNSILSGTVESESKSDNSDKNSECLNENEQDPQQMLNENSSMRHFARLSTDLTTALYAHTSENSSSESDNDSEYSNEDEQGALELVKRLEEVRLLESRKSARLMDQDTDFARLADMAGGERKRQASHTIDVPATTGISPHGSRKRRPSHSYDEGSRDALMDECNAALVLMSLSCSPHSPNIGSIWGGTSPGGISSSSSASWRSGSPSPSPPLSESDAVASSWGMRISPPPTHQSTPTSDEGIGLDEDELPRKKKANRVVFQCTWPGCLVITSTCTAIEAHVRTTHLRDEKPLDHEEEFYYTEVEMGQHTSSPPTMSHRDMARPPHEDPEYQRQIVGTIRQGLLAGQAGPINIPPITHTTYQYHHQQPSSPQKLLKLSPRPVSSYPYPSPSSASPPALLALNSGKSPASPSRRIRGENKKCRKVYGMEHREQWCTQCKWKKACSRFGD